MIQYAYLISTSNNFRELNEDMDAIFIILDARRAIFNLDRAGRAYIH